MIKALKLVCLVVFCLGILCACSSRSADGTGTVQDLQPGEKSMIQPPARQQNSGSTLEERNI